MAFEEEKMFTSRQKIRVFISSACGKESWKQKYNYVREGLKILIESTGLAEVYVFESEGASTISAEQHYLQELENCDVCIFLIDNKDGVPDGVQKEIDIANKCQIKSLYYFCNEFEITETPLQKSLTGSQYAKSTTIHNFKDILKQGSTDLINDLITIYKNYCRGRLYWIEESSSSVQGENSDFQLLFYPDNVIKTELLSNIDCCTKYFFELILGTSNGEVTNTSTFDKKASEMLPVLFEGANYNSEIASDLLSEIKKYQNPEHYQVVEKRYEALKEYFSGNQKECIRKLNEALQLAKDNSIAEWLKKDILIDLRNQELSLNQSLNTYLLNSEYQEALTNDQMLLYYPQLDRLDSSFYDEIIEQVIRSKIKSPETIFLSNGVQQSVKLLAGTYIISLFNGSLTHIEMIYKRIIYLCFLGASRYSDWKIKKVLLESTIIYYRDSKKTDEVIQYFGDLLSSIDEKDAYEIYQFANNSRIPYQKFICKLESFRVVAYFLNDENYEEFWLGIYQLIRKWIKDENSPVVVARNIFFMLEQTYLRIPQDHLMIIICECIINKKSRYYDKLFRLIAYGVDLNTASSELVGRLLGLIIKIVKNPTEREQITTLEMALITLRKKFKNLTEELDEVISIEMPNFYNDTYLLETTENENEDLPNFIESNITKIHEYNKAQGKNGRYYELTDSPHITIKNILSYSSVEWSEELINSIFQASCETLLCTNQSIKIKMDAIELLVYLLNSTNGLMERNKKTTDKILSNKDQVTSANAILTNLNETNLMLSTLFLYHSLGEDINMDLIKALVDIGKDVFSNRKASASFLNFIEASKLPLIDNQLEQIILQKSIEWCASPDFTTRCNAIQTLFLLLNNLKNKNIICNQIINVMDNDNIYIKIRILKNLHLLKDVDIETYKYIIQKASIDSNFLVRKVVKAMPENDRVNECSQL